MLNHITLNMLILGQTGVGKSSLLNKLLDSNKAKTGIGRPQTSEGIYEYEGSIKNRPIMIYDSWGLEVGKEKEWEKIINNELRKKGISKDMKEWFHTITYCISAGSSRIQEFDANMIKKFINDKYNVIVVLTKSDIADPDENKMLIDSIKKLTGAEDIVEISASPKKLPGMLKAVKPFGIDKYEKLIFVSWKKIFIERIPLHIIKKLENSIKNKRTKLKNTYFESNDLKQISQEISSSFQKMLKNKLKFYFEDSIKGYSEITSSIALINISHSVNNIDINLSNINIDTPYYFWKDFPVDFDSIEGTIATIIASMIMSPILIPMGIVGGIFDIFTSSKFKNGGKEKAINKFIDEISSKLISEINKKEFENNIRDKIINVLDSNNLIKKLNNYLTRSKK